MSNEIKIGLLSIVTIVLMLWGYKFVEGQNIFSASKLLKVEYENAGGLGAGTTVMRSGFQVGVVTDIYLNPENLRTVIVEMDVNPDLPIPKNTVAAIATVDFLGEKNIQLLFDRPCQEGNCAVSGDFLQPGSKGVLASMIGSPEEVKTYVDAVSAGVTQLLDSLGSASADENSILGRTLADVNEILQQVKITIANANGVITQNSDEIKTTLDNISAITGSIAEREAQIQSIINSADSTMQKLAALDLSTTMHSADGAIDNLNTTLSSANVAVKDLRTILETINEGNGTLGKLVNDKDLYLQMDEAIRNLDLLLEDFRLNPARYTTILKKKRPSYEKPKEEGGEDQAQSKN
ncbi:MAG: MlaD family protein [Bacteroidota bacterium]